MIQNIRVMANHLANNNNNNNDMMDWKSIGVVKADIKGKKATPIGVKLLDIGLSPYIFSKETGINTVILNKLTTYGSDVTSIELISSCRYLGLGYDSSYADVYNIFNREDNLLRYLWCIRGYSKSYLGKLLDLRTSGIEEILKDTSILTSVQLEKLKEILGIVGDIDFSLNVYDLFKNGDYTLLDRYLRVTSFTGISSNIKTNNVEKWNTDKVKGSDVLNKNTDSKVNTIDTNTSNIIGSKSSLKEDIEAIHKALLNISNYILEVEENTRNLEELVNSLIHFAEHPIDELDGVDDTDNESSSKDSKGETVVDTYHSMFYDIRLLKGLSKEKVSEDTGLDMKVLDNLERAYVDHHKNSCKILREYYGVGSEVYLRGVSDKLSLFGYLLDSYDISTRDYVVASGLGFSTINKLKYKDKVDSNYVVNLISYLSDKELGNIEERVDKYNKEIKANSYTIQ